MKLLDDEHGIPLSLRHIERGRTRRALDALANARHTGRYHEWKSRMRGDMPFVPDTIDHINHALDRIWVVVELALAMVGVSAIAAMALWR
jgi:hypothetical protein